MIPLLLAFLIPPEPIPRNIASFTAADVRRYEGREVFFFGDVVDQWGVDELYVASLKTEGLNRYHCHALVSRAQWRELEPGKQVCFRAILKTHEADGEWYAVLWVLP